MRACDILYNAARLADRCSKHRDDLWYEMAWTLYWLASTYDPQMGPEKTALVSERSRVPLNKLLTQAYQEGIV